MNNQTKDDGGPAFPVPPEAVVGNEGNLIVLNEYGLGPTSGMSLRDWFAGQALTASEWPRREQTYDSDARQCYAMADAMLKARQQ